MYEVKPNLVIGFHGCDRSVRDSLLMNPKDYQISQKPFDWLGHGLYFWENNYDRAFEWATQKKYRGGIKEPAVVGAVLSLGHCCDFLDKRFIETLAFYFSYMKPYYAGLGKQLPQNEDLKHDIFKDKILRNLDGAAIEYMHGEILDQVKLDIGEKGYSKLKVFDSTRAVFIEGGPAFEGAGLFERTHIQICIRNPNCIQGFFMPREEIDFMEWLDKNAIHA